MGGLFSKKKAPSRVTEQDKAVLVSSTSPVRVDSITITRKPSLVSVSVGIHVDLQL